MTDKNWTTIPFDEAVQINPSVPLHKGSVYPFVDMQAIEPSHRSVAPVEKRDFKGGGSRFIQGDTLMARITPCLENGKIARYESSDTESMAHGSTEFIVIRGRPDVTDNNFAYYLTYWDSVRQYAISQMTGTSGRQRVPTDSLAHLEVSIPPLSEQQVIAHILGTLDDKIELNRAMNDTLEEMARAIFKSWFVDFDPVRAKAEGRKPFGMDADTAAMFPSSFQDSPIGRIPEGWSIGCLGDIAENKKVSVKPQQLGEYSHYIGLEHMPRRCITLSEWSTTESIASNKYAFREGDLLFGKLRPYFHKVGIAAVDGVCSTDILVVIAKEPSWWGYVLEIISSIDFVNYTDMASTGTKMPRTNWKDMSMFETVLPPVELAEAFTSFIFPMTQKIISNVHESQTLAAIRDALLPKLMSGELRIPDLETIKETAEPFRQHVGTIYTIGHSNHSIEKFINLLKQHDITAVADVRSTPYSRYNPQFNREDLAKSLKKAGIAYSFLGKEFGARPEEREYYKDGRADFDKMSQRQEFIEGIERVRKGIAKHKVALMCAEKDPLDCHRTILVSRNLKAHRFQVEHILSDGNVEEHGKTETRLLKLTGYEPMLFDQEEDEDQRLDMAYEKRAKDIAYHNE